MNKGRPSDFTQETADIIVSKLSQGIPLAAICRTEGMPTPRTVYNWMEKDEAFSSRIAGARDEGFDAIAVDALAIADDASGDIIETSRGPKMDAEFVARSRLRVETRLKLLAKWSPAKYGERLDVTGIPAGQGVNIMLPVRERIARLRRAAGGESGESLSLPSSTPTP